MVSDVYFCVLERRFMCTAGSFCSLVFSISLFFVGFLSPCRGLDQADLVKIYTSQSTSVDDRLASLVSISDSLKNSADVRLYLTSLYYCADLYAQRGRYLEAYRCHGFILKQVTDAHLRVESLKAVLHWHYRGLYSAEIVREGGVYSTELLWCLGNANLSDLVELENFIIGSEYSKNGLRGFFTAIGSLDPYVLGRIDSGIKDGSMNKVDFYGFADLIRERAVIVGAILDSVDVSFVDALSKVDSCWMGGSFVDIVRRRQSLSKNVSSIQRKIDKKEHWTAIDAVYHEMSFIGMSVQRIKNSGYGDLWDWQVKEMSPMTRCVIDASIEAVATKQ